MSTSTTTPVRGTSFITETFSIVTHNGYFYVLRNNAYSTNRDGLVRTFISRASARKHISRIRRSNFHS